MVKLNKIYTRTGDDGTTGLVDGSRLAKSDRRMAAIGDVDEANSALGIAIAVLATEHSDDPLIASLQNVQNDLFDLGADIATPGPTTGDDFAPTPMTLRIVQSQIDRLESAIDAATNQLGPLTSFILPGGSVAAAQMHLARAITRRAERSLVAAASHAAINPLALQYLNRLSDYLFTLCRLINQTRGGDILWVPGASR
jgi:cob(I)alamin adenosyltransferase